MPERKHTCPMCGHALASSIVIPAGEAPVQASNPAGSLRILDAGLSTRATNLLLLMGLDRVGEVCEYTATDLLRERGMGLKSLNEIIALLASRGLALKDPTFVPSQDRAAARRSCAPAAPVAPAAHNHHHHKAAP